MQHAQTRYAICVASLMGALEDLAQITMIAARKPVTAKGFPEGAATITALSPSRHISFA